jgi:hypothetical protein
MATLSVQNLALSGLQYSFASAASGGDVFANDGKTFVLITNGNASTRTATFDVPTANESVSVQGLGPVSIADTAITVPGSGTNGGRIMVGPFPPSRFNNSSGQVSITYSDSAADLTIAVVRMPNYA